MKPIVGLVVITPLFLLGMALALKVDPLREGAILVAFWTCFITCGAGVRRALAAGDKRGAILPVAVFVGGWLGPPLVAAWLGALELAYLGFVALPVALVLGFRLVLRYPPKE